nr:unnamed protein product [Digitaria exilis]
MRSEGARALVAAGALCSGSKRRREARGGARRCLFPFANEDGGSGGYPAEEWDDVNAWCGNDGILRLVLMEGCSVVDPQRQAGLGNWA